MYSNELRSASVVQLTFVLNLTDMRDLSWRLKNWKFGSFKLNAHNSSSSLRTSGFDTFKMRFQNVLSLSRPENVRDKLLTCLSSLTKVGSKRVPSSWPWWFGYCMWLKLLLKSFFSGRKIFSTCLGSAWRGTTTFFAFLIYSNLMCETFLWSTIVGSWVGT